MNNCLIINSNIVIDSNVLIYANDSRLNEVENFIKIFNYIEDERTKYICIKILLPNFDIIKKVFQEIGLKIACIFPEMSYNNNLHK